MGEALDMERVRQEARAEAFEDAAHIIKNAWKHGAKCETEQDWLTMSYTFSNQAVLIRRALAAPCLSPDPALK
jgi:hypothetical protein